VEIPIFLSYFPISERNEILKKIRLVFSGQSERASSQAIEKEQAEACSFIP